MSTRDSQPVSGDDIAPGVGAAHPGRNRRKPHDPVLLERLAETGFLATEFGLDDQAERIFRGLVQLKPGKPSPYIALAMVEARRGRVDSAIDTLRQLIDAHPQADLARAVLGTMLVHAGRPGARELFEGVIQCGSDPNAVSVAASCLEQLRAQEAQGADKAQVVLEFHRHHNVRG